MSTINPHLLPAALRELVRVLGEATAFRLVERRGGGRLIVPKKVHADHRLNDELGFKAFVDLVEHYGGEVLDLPKHDSVVRQLRHQRVRTLRAEGHTMDRVAVLTGYTRRQVINILGDCADLADGRQLDMFGAAEPARATAADKPDPDAFRANDPFGLGRRRA